MNKPTIFPFIVEEHYVAIFVRHDEKKMYYLDSFQKKKQNTYNAAVETASHIVFTLTTQRIATATQMMLAN